MKQTKQVSAQGGVSHTPGPWVVLGENAADGRGIYHGKDYVGHTAGFEPRPGSNLRTLTKEEALANARLIAAAPELLEACKSALAAYHVEKSLQMGRGESIAVDMAFAGKKLEEAITKAEGRQ